jgi:hypothetical protein
MLRRRKMPQAAICGPPDKIDGRGRHSIAPHAMNDFTEHSARPQSAIVTCGRQLRHENR